MISGQVLMEIEHRETSLAGVCVILVHHSLGWDYARKVTMGPPVIVKKLQVALQGVEEITSVYIIPNRPVRIRPGADKVAIVAEFDPHSNSEKYVRQRLYQCLLRVLLD